MDATTFTIRPIVEQDWNEYRALRLQMLEEIPIAFGERLESARILPEAAWRSRCRRGTGGNAIRFAAIEDATGRWLGSMGGFLSPDDGNRPVLVGVYVVPGSRGTAAGITDALLAAVEHWAHRFGDTLLLHVHEDNPRAIGAYEKRGFVPTGTTVPYPMDTSQRELEMVKRLGTS